MIKLTWYGTYSIKLESSKEKILFDPFIRYEKKNSKSFRENFYDIKNIFITHGHLDHTMDLYNLYHNKDVLIHTTKSVYERLMKKGISIKRLYKINYGDEYNLEDIKINVIHGKHVRFDLKLIIKTLFNKNIIKYFKNLLLLIKANNECKEKKETVNYLVTVDNKKLLFMGSMATNKKTIYPKNIDYLILAYQGRSDLDKKLDEIIDTIKPKNIVLTHFDNSFPPLSSNIDVENIKKDNIKIIIPKYEKEIILK